MGVELIVIFTETTSTRGLCYLLEIAKERMRKLHQYFVRCPEDSIQMSLAVLRWIQTCAYVAIWRVASMTIRPSPDPVGHASNA